MDVVRLAVIAGPTASGKSALALHLAERVPVTIISADSRQVYRGFDVGTAKPTADEQARVPHALIDLADPTERVSAARWANEAGRAIDLARAVGRVPLVVGGTGLYLRALFEPLFEEPTLDPEQRGTLERELATRDTAALRAEVEDIDPARAHLGRTQLLRAIEIYRLTGESISTWHVRNRRPSRFAPRYLVVEQGAKRGDRIEARVDAMLTAGWVDEVRRLHGAVASSAPAWNATGYSAIHQVVTGALTLGTARQQVVVQTRQFAKRQRTWFRHQLPVSCVTRVDLGDPNGMDEVRVWWHSMEPS